MTSANLNPISLPRKKVTSVIATLNGLFLDSVERSTSGFRARFWKVLDDVIETEKSQVFTYDPGFGSSAGTLWSTNYFFYNKNLKKIVFFLVSGTSKLAIVSQEGETSDVEMDEMDDTVDDEEPKKVDRPVQGYIDFDLIDMEDLGLEAIDIPPSTWISNDFSSSSSSSSSVAVPLSIDSLTVELPFQETKTRKLSTSSTYSRSMFSNNPSPSGAELYTSGSPFFVEPSTSSIMSSDLTSLFSPARG